MSCKTTQPIRKVTFVGVEQLLEFSDKVLSNLRSGYEELSGSGAHQLYKTNLAFTYSIKNRDKS